MLSVITFLSAAVLCGFTEFADGRLESCLRSDPACMAEAWTAGLSLIFSPVITGQITWAASSRPSAFFWCGILKSLDMNRAQRGRLAGWLLKHGRS